MKPFKLSELCNFVSGHLIGEDLKITGINALPLAKETEISFVDSLKRVPQAKESKAKALLTPIGFSKYLSEKSLIEVRDLRCALAKITFLFKEKIPFKPGISPLSYISPSAQIHPNTMIYPYVYVGEGVKIEEKVIIYPFCFIGDFCEIGQGSILYPHVVLYPGSKIGKNCILHAGVVIGADGFGYAQEPLNEGFKNLKIYHFGRVRIEEEVEIGANTTIDRATFGETSINRGTKIDNLVQIGHNVRIGKECILVSHTAIGGSVVIEDYVMLAGQVGIAPQSVVRKGAKVAAKSGVVGEVPEGEEVAGIPAIKASLWRKAVVIFAKLPELYKEFKNLIKKGKSQSS
ncbi:MAG: UDP-3-O-(3-hydroxymyristoyl)glucosamine N-acyltransferase [Caldimicrobium sp.]